MPTPYDGYRLIHNALLEESRGFDEAIESLDWTDHDGVTEAQGRFSAYRKVLTTHEHSEDTWFFSLVAPKFPEAVAMYSYDHRHHHNLYGEIQGLFEALAAPRGAVDAASLARQLQKRTIALRALMDSHIAKENELLVPIFEKHVDMEELARVEAEENGKVPMEDQVGLILWMFPRLAGADRLFLYQWLKDELPPEDMDGLVPALSGTVSAKEWTELQSAVS